MELCLDARVPRPHVWGRGQVRGHLSRLADFHGFLQIDRDQLRDAAFRHGDPVEPVHPGHGHTVVGDHQKAGAFRFGHLFEHRAESVDVGVIQRGVDLVQHADRCRIRQKHCEQQRQCRQRLLPTRKQCQVLQFLARRRGQNFKSGIQRVFGVGQFQMGMTATEQLAEQFLEVLVY